MAIMKFKNYLRAFMLLALTLTTSAEVSFENFVVFGDELSDTGNAYKLTNYEYPPSPPYYKGRFSNGKNWVDYFVEEHDLCLYNYAYGSASSDNTLVPTFTGPKNVSVPGVFQQVNQFLEKDCKKINVEKTLFAVAALCADYVFTLGQIDAAEVVERVGNSIKALHESGDAKYIFISPIPPVDHVPAIKSLPTETAELIESKIALHNKLLFQFLDDFQAKHSEVKLYVLKNMNEIIDHMFEPKILKELGITVTDKPCVPDNGYAGKDSIVCDHPEEYVFFDTFQALNTKIYKYISDEVTKLVWL
ncbi:13579_t:CDS:2 [Acaulospora morrowiae]|uniref:13579_t:CDS:1 n=1 Tax=Acaulospora morrowiae TaxID=94023 RepID=A0A9N8YR60_9GLOM|nr:13579_t:CDS:2 [Acaulospora morrowiae]